MSPLYCNICLDRDNLQNLQINLRLLIKNTFHYLLLLTFGLLVTVIAQLRPSFAQTATVQCGFNQTIDNRNTILAGANTFAVNVQSTTCQQVINQYLSEIKNTSVVAGTAAIAVNMTPGVNAYVGYIDNKGTISGLNSIYNFSGGAIINLLNSNQITGAILNEGSIGTLQNGLTANITANAGALQYALKNVGNIDKFVNYGTTTASGADTILNSGTIGSVYNSYKITSGDGSGINNNGGTISAINNNGQYAVISGTANGIKNTGLGLIKSIINSGSIKGDDYGLLNTGAITTLYNSGDIVNNAGTEGIKNDGSINTLQNDIGPTRSSGIQILRGNAPSHYQMNFSDSSYTSLYAYPGLAGSMSYGVIAGEPTVSQKPGNYAAVLVNVPSSSLTNTSGTFGARGRYTLCETAPGSGVWDMVIAGGCNKLSFSYATPGDAAAAQSVKTFAPNSNWIGTGWTPFLGFYDPDVGNTYQALTANRNQVEGAMHQRYAVMNALMWYDCNRFDKHNLCISMQARETGMGTQASGAGVLNIAYRPHEKIHTGVYLDYQVGPGAAQANQMITFGPYQGGVQSGYNNASFGAYVGFNDKADGTGLVARASGGYNPGKVTISRNANLGFTEPGMGTAGLNAYYAFGYGGYGISIGERTVFTPYAGLRYTNVIRNSYSEVADLASVLFPFSYNSYYEQLLTGMTGGQLSGKLTDRLGYNIGLGAEIDFARNANAYSGSSAATGLQAFGIEHGGAWNGVRPNGLIGGFYELSPREQFVINGYAGQQAFTSRNYLTGLAGYQVAF